MVIQKAHTDSAEQQIAVVIPCYRVRDHVLEVLGQVPAVVDSIICVDDGCPDGSGKQIKAEVNDPRVEVIFNERNLGVGGAMTAGYLHALKKGATVIVKLDGDGQMDPALIPRLVRPILHGQADYAKGNRLYRPESVREMPRLRLFGNAILSFMAKLSSGYWDIFDCNNGFTAIHASVLKLLPLNKLAPGYFFESDMLFRLSTVNAVVIDVPMDARYREERSSLVISRIVLPFFVTHVRNFLKRIAYNYYVRDFNVASLQLLLGLPLFLFGLIFGSVNWWDSAATGTPASAGTVMLAALTLLTGLMLLLSFLSFDIARIPREPVHRLIGDSPFSHS